MVHFCLGQVGPKVGPGRPSLEFEKCLIISLAAKQLLQCWHWQFCRRFNENISFLFEKDEVLHKVVCEWRCFHWHNFEWREANVSQSDRN